MRSPRCRQSIMKRQSGVGVGGDVKNGKIVGNEGIAKTAEGNRDEDELCLSGRGGYGDPRLITSASSNHWQDGLRQGQEQRQDQCELSDFWDHDSFYLSIRVFPAFALSIACPASGGM